MFIEKIDAWSQRCPHRIAHRHRDSATTYETLKTHSDALCLWIEEQSRGIGRTPVVVYGHKQAVMLAAFLACGKAGLPYVPVDGSVPAGRLRQIIDSSGARIVLTAAPLPEALGKTTLQGSLAPAPPCYAAHLGQVPPAAWALRPEDVCYIIYTSGSTGVPKGVQITRRSLESFLDWVGGLYRPLEAAEVFLNQAPFSFDLSVMDLYMSLVSGGTLWSVDRDQAASPAALFDSLGESRVTFWVSTPSFAAMCLADPGFNSGLLPDLKYFLFCGEVLAHDTAARLKSRFPGARVENMYGPTEACVAVTSLTVTAAVLNDYNPLPVGRPKPDCRVLVCRPEELNRLMADGTPPGPPEPLPEGEPGEIVIAGPSVSAGYLNNPGQTRKSFFAWADGGRTWPAYRTGDAGFWRDGLLFFQGRFDFQLKLHGYRIEPGDIEEHLRRVDWVGNAVVLGVEQNGRVAYLKAFVTTPGPVDNQFEARLKLRNSLLEKLPGYMIPRSFAFLERLPMTPNGKVDRRRLLEESR